jgi:hypothetical protein
VGEQRCGTCKNFADIGPYGKCLWNAPLMPFFVTIHYRSVGHEQGEDCEAWEPMEAANA